MTNNIPNDLIKLQNNADLYSKLAESIPRAQPNVNLPKMSEVIVRNPNEEVENLLNQQNEKLDQQTKELRSIRYENMKLNAQIEVLNKTVDSQNNELEKLRNINSELKVANQMLKDNNRHYWRNTFIAGFAVAAIFFVLGLIV